MEHVSFLLKKVLAKRGLKNHAETSLIIYHATRWIESELSPFKEFVIAKQFKDGILIMETRNSLSAQECHQKLEDLKSHLTEDCGHTNLASIRLIRA